MDLRKELRVAAVQCNTLPLDKKEFNVKRIITTIQRTGKTADLMIFPELSVGGYGGDPTSSTFRKLLWKAAEDVPGPTTKRIEKAAKDAGCCVAFGLVLRSNLPFAVHNAAVLVGPDGYMGHTCKTHLSGAYDDAPYYPGREVNVFKSKVGMIGLMICYEMWFPEVGRLLALKGAEVIVSLSSAFAGGSSGGIGTRDSKRAMWDTLPRAIALSNLVHVVACNGAGRVFMGRRLGYWKRLGRTRIINALGGIVAENENDKELIVKGVLTEDVLQTARTCYSLLRDRVPYLYGPLAGDLW